jgi:hypothetical protein
MKPINSFKAKYDQRSYYVISGFQRPYLLNGRRFCGFERSIVLAPLGGLGGQKPAESKFPVNFRSMVRWFESSIVK